jgi:hypothetical protein
LGEVEGIDLTLAFLRDKRAQAETHQHPRRNGRAGHARIYLRGNLNPGHDDWRLVTAPSGGRAAVRHE